MIDEIAIGEPRNGQRLNHPDSVGFSLTSVTADAHLLPYVGRRDVG
jgi:hypothetical protein